MIRKKKGPRTAALIKGKEELSKMMIRSKVQALSTEVSDDYCTAAKVRETSSA